MQNNVDTEKGVIIQHWIPSLGGKIKRYYQHFESHQKLITTLSATKSYGVHETMLPGTRRKPYIDIEETYASKSIFNANHSDIVDKTINYLVEIFQKQYQTDIVRDDIKMMANNRPIDKGYKMGYHFIVSPKKSLYYTDSKITHSSAYHWNM